MSKEKGIDISYWQGNIDFKKVKMSDIKFVILREGYRQTMDKRFMDYVFGCRTWGIRIDGVYHFIYLPNDRVPSNAEIGRLNAESCLKNVKNAQITNRECIIWCDLEYDTITHAKRQHGITLSNQDIREITVSFCNTIAKAGYRVGIYTNLDYAKNRYGMDFIKNYDIWLADYAGTPDIDCLYQQYTSEGQVDGINGKVDMNWKFDTKEETVMGVTAQDVLNVMRSWLGYSEANGKHRIIIDLYNSHPPLARGYKVKYTDEWCDTCVSAAAIKAGARDLIGTECGCEKHIEIFKAKGIWQEDGTVRPQVGWIILYNWDDGTQPNDGYSDHIGYVEEVYDTYMIVIEGNKGEAVARRKLTIGHGNIRGYACPKYAQSSSNRPVQPPKQDVTTVAQQVIAGLWGNGDDRKARLESAGYSYSAVQAEVNRLLGGGSSKPSLKPVSTVAKEVLQGLWGNGEDRKKRLQNAGYDYNAVQNEVNKLCGGSSINQAEVDRVARLVIRGDFGNGTNRRNALVQRYGTAFADAVQNRVNQLL